MAAQQTLHSWLPARFLLQLLSARLSVAFICVRRPRLRAAVSTACAGITQRAPRCTIFSGNARVHLINAAVMLSEAKHLCLFPLMDRSRFDPRFFASLRMTL